MQYLLEKSAKEHQIKEKTAEVKRLHLDGLDHTQKMKAIIKQVDLYPEGLPINDASFCMRSEGKP